MMMNQEDNSLSINDKIMGLQQNKFADLQFTPGSLNYSPVIGEYFFLNLDELNYLKQNVSLKTNCLIVFLLRYNLH